MNDESCDSDSDTLTFCHSDNEDDIYLSDFLAENEFKAAGGSEGRSSESSSNYETANEDQPTTEGPKTTEDPVTTEGPVNTEGRSASSTNSTANSQWICRKDIDEMKYNGKGEPLEWLVQFYFS